MMSTKLTAFRLGMSTAFRMLSTTQAVDRWHSDIVKDRNIYRYGYQDKCKRSGALPRISNDEETRWSVMDIHTPENPFAQKRALLGQNDYIDILGEDPDMFKPSELNYAQPEWLRKVDNNMTPYLRALYKKRMLEKTSYPETHPNTYHRLNMRIFKRYGKQQKYLDQYQFSNYRGIAIGTAKNRFKSKQPF